LAPAPQQSPKPASNNNLWLLTVGAGFLALLIFVMGFGIGFGVSRWGGSVSGGPGATGDGTAQERLYPAFATFWEAMDVLYGNFYGELPAANEATYAAIRGVLGQLDDQNTSFMTPEESEYFRTSLQGSFEGIGAQVNWDEEYNTVRIVEPYENQPAWNAGIRRDDLVIAVDGVEVVGTDLTSAVTMIRGPKGSTVVLTVVRKEVAEPFDIDVVRDTIEIPTIATDRLGPAGEIGYVRLNTFNENAGELVRQAMDEAVADGVTGLVFDLRGNPGGLLRQAVSVSSIFLDDKQVLIERFADGEETIYETENEQPVIDLPLVVLVNAGSASASEIVAGALQDHNRATLVGTVTYGKGSVQLPQPLADGSILRVTVARWFTPNDRTIDGTGLEPDVAVELSEEDLELGRDPQMDEALKLLGVEPVSAPVE
jgi:carboxyl-terminal processing protease